MIDEADMPIPRLHRMYCEQTGLNLELTYWRRDAWAQWSRLWDRHDWKPEEGLRLVLAYLTTEIRKGNRNPGAIRFRNMIEHTDYAEEEIAMALAARRNQQRPKVPADKQAVLRATGRPTEPQQPGAKPVGEVLDSALERKLPDWYATWKKQTFDTNPGGAS